MAGFIIRRVSGSAAETYAADNRIAFEDLNGIRAADGIDFKTTARELKGQNRLEVYDETYSDTEDRVITKGIPPKG